MEASQRGRLRERTVASAAWRTELEFVRGQALARPHGRGEVGLGVRPLGAPVPFPAECLAVEVELYATVVRTYGSAACFQEEADAFSWEAGVWSRLPSQYKTGASSAGNNAITGIWQRSGVAGLLSAVKGSAAYQQQCSRG